jgi:cell cycle sensor histidine kinase DivJ
LSSAATRYVDFSDAVAAGCERLVHPSIVDAGQRRTHRRLVGVLLAAPFLAAGAAVALATAKLGAAPTIAVIFALFGLGWLAAMLVTATGRARLVGGAALVVASLASGGLIAAAGGLASPVALLCLALPAEAFWVLGARRAVVWGGIAAIAAALLQFALGSALPIVGQPAAWHWLIPLAWAATLPVRFGRFRQQADGRTEDEPDSRLEDVIDAVVFRVGHGGEVFDVSARALPMLDLAPQLLEGTGLFERVHLADRVAYLSAIADLREGAALRRLELRLRLPKPAGTAGDNYRSFLVELMRSGDDRPSIAVLRENDGVAELRAALAAANETAAGADVAKSRFLAAVSHELRTPLNVILGFSDMLLHEMFGSFADPRQKEYVSLIRQSGQHLLEVVTSILDISRLESGTYTALPEPFRFAEAVEMCQSMMSLPAGQKNIALTTQIAADAGEINADRRAVQQILINLASNAIKFTPDGGQVAIGARRIGSRLHFWVSDTGIGIAEADMANLGKPFTQIHNDYTRRYEGTGLGLSLVKGLVALHDGTMAIESAPGEGTRVSISLPVDGPTERPHKPVVVPMPQARNAKEGSDGPLRQTA